MNSASTGTGIEVVGENGPFDEPNFCYEEGRAFAGNSLYRQAAAQFDRATTLAPENIVARLWLAQLYVISQKPGEALKLVEPIHVQPGLLAAARTNRTELLFVETSAHLAQGDVGGAEATVRATMREYPGEENLLATATQVYMRYGCFSNALITLDQQLALSPTNMNALVNKGYACIQLGAFDQAIPPLTQVLAVANHQLFRAAQSRHRLSARRQTGRRAARLRSLAKGLSDCLPDLLRPGGDRLAEQRHQRGHPQLPTLPGQCSDQHHRGQAGQRAPERTEVRLALTAPDAGHTRHHAVDRGRRTGKHDSLCTGAARETGRGGGFGCGANARAGGLAGIGSRRLRGPAHHCAATWCARSIRGRTAWPGESLRSCFAPGGLRSSTLTAARPASWGGSPRPARVSRSSSTPFTGRPSARFKVRWPTRCFVLRNVMPPGSLRISSS